METQSKVSQMHNAKAQSFFVSFDDENEAKSQSVSESFESADNKDDFIRQLRHLSISMFCTNLI